MTKNTDIRWMQRFDSYKKALTELREGVELAGERVLSKLEKQGVIQAFEFTHELAWNCLKDFLEDRGNKGIYGSKDATRTAFKSELIENGQIWMNMIGSRNSSSHTYNQETAEEIFNLIIEKYFYEFEKLSETFTDLLETYEKI